MTRVAILERAQEMYVDRELIHGDERLSVVLEDLGYTTGAGYQIWSNQAEFRRDLQVFVAERLEPIDLSGVVEDVQAVGRDDFDGLVGLLTDSLIDRVLACDDFFLGLRFYAMAEDRPAEVATALKATAERFLDALGQALQEALCLVGRRVRTGLNPRVLAEAVAALLYGLALQQRLDWRSIDIPVDFPIRPAAHLAMAGLLETSSEPEA